MTDPTALIQRAQAQTQANRYAYLLSVINAKLTEKIRTSS